MVKTVLVADDNPTIRKLLCRMFEREENYDLCAEAEDGKQAIELAVQHHPDLVILDLSMPVMNGLESAHELKKHGSCAVACAGVVVQLLHFNRWPVQLFSFDNQEIFGSLSDRVTLLRVIRTMGDFLRACNHGAFNPIYKIGKFFAVGLSGCLLIPPLP